MGAGHPPMAWRLDGYSKLVLGAVLIRILLLPLTHTWDGQTWASVFAELAQPGSPLEAVRRPYETMRELSLLTQAGGRHADFYEYWAYPPLMLYVYWPLARAYEALGGILEPSFPAAPAFIAPTIPIFLAAFVRLPVVAADVAVLFLFRQLGVPMRDIRCYAFNPFVLLVGVWTFDPVMVAFFLGALLLAERGRWALSGAVLALGAGTKFVPAVALPAIVLGCLVGQRDARSQLRSVASALLAFVVTLALLVGPVVEGLLYVLGFHAARFGTGLTAYQGLRAWSSQPAPADWQPPWQLYASVELGTLTLVLALLMATYLATSRPSSPVLGFLLPTLAFLAGAKVVNEPYALAALALLTVAVARTDSPVLRGCRTLIWSIALGYAAVNTPVWAFFFSVAQQLAPELAPAISSWSSAYRLFLVQPEAVLPYAVLGSAFTVVTMSTMWLAWRLGAAQATGAAVGK